MTSSLARRRPWAVTSIFISVLTLLATGAPTAPALVRMPAAYASIDIAGSYEGKFDEAEVLKFDGTVHQNKISLTVTGSFDANDLALSGLFVFHFETTDKQSGQIMPDAISICELFKIELKPGQLTGIAAPGDEVGWSGTIDLRVGGGDPTKMNCTTVDTERTQPAKLDVTIGSNGVRGSLSTSAAIPFRDTFTAAKTAGAAPPPSANPPDNPKPDTGNPPDASTDNLPYALGELVNEADLLLSSDLRPRLLQLQSDTGLKNFPTPQDIGKISNEAGRVFKVDLKDPGKTRVLDAMATAIALSRIVDGSGTNKFPSLRTNGSTIVNMAKAALGPPLDKGMAEKLYAYIALSMGNDLQK